MTRLQARYASIPQPWRSVSILLLAVVLLPLAADARGRPEGEEVVVAGVVADGAGNPLAGVTVELRGSHRAFSLRDFRVARRGFRKASATSDSRGQYEIRWIWHPYFNRFELVAGLALGPPGPESKLEVLASADLSRRMRSGNPVVATLEIADRSLVDAMNQFMDTVDSDDKRKVYQETGKPDKVRDTVLPTYQETSWWYFEQGKVYRFRDGEIQGVDDFEPILASPD